jgi:hypothetical protein
MNLTSTPSLLTNNTHTSIHQSALLWGRRRRRITTLGRLRHKTTSTPSSIHSPSKIRPPKAFTTASQEQEQQEVQQPRVQLVQLREVQQQPPMVLQSKWVELRVLKEQGRRPMATPRWQQRPSLPQFRPSGLRTFNFVSPPAVDFKSHRE